MSGIQERFERDAERQAEAIRALGVDARVGEVPGEYCPGPFTVNARGERKLLGSAQRIVRGGWLLSTVVVVDGAARLRAVLDDVYGALGLEWSRDTVGAIADEAPGAGIDAVEEALLRSYRVVREGVLTPDDLAGAAATIGRFEVR
jgi:lipoate-protein ligase A